MSSLSFKKIIVPVDFSGTSLRALEHAKLLAKKNEAEITLVHIIEHVPSTISRLVYPPNSFDVMDTEMDKAGQRRAELLERRETHAKKELVRLESELKKDKITVGSSVIESGKIAKKINAIAKKQGTDIIIMGTHGTSGVREFMVGSNTYKVVNEAKCPVLSLREDRIAPGFKTILLPFMDRPHMREHVDYAIRLAKIYGATIDILGIDTEKETNHFRKVKLEAEQIKKIAEKSGVKCKMEVYPASYMNEFITAYGKKDRADLIIIMADVNKVGVMQYFTGPVVQQIVNHSPIPVLSIPPTFNPKTMW